MALLPVERRRTAPSAPGARAAVEPGAVPPRPPARAARTAAVAAGALLLLVVLVLALTVGGARPDRVTAGLPDPGALTRWGLPVAELVARLLAVLTVGRLLLAAVLVPKVPSSPSFPAGGAVVAATWSAAAWLTAEVAVLVLTASSLYAVPVADVSAQAVLALLTDLPVGRSAVVVAVLLVGLVVGCALATRRAHAGLLLLPALAAVVVPVVTAGHSASADDHVAAVTTLSVHVVAASLWVGGLAALLLHGCGRAWTADAVRRFSGLALGCVVVLALSGAAAAVLVVGGPSAVLGSGYGGLLLAKTGLLVALAGLGWWHRRVSLPALVVGRPRAFLRLAVAEVALMGAVVAVSVGLSASPPPEAAAPSAAPAPAQTQTQGEAAADSQGEGAATGTASEAAGEDPQAEDMTGHDHGELSVGVLVDAERFHVSSPVRPSQRVTVYNSSDQEATLTARDGSFDAVVPARTFITFEAPAVPGSYAFVSSRSAGFADVLHVRGD